MDAVLAHWGVYDQVDRAVRDEVEDVRTSLVELLDRLRVDPCLRDQIVGSLGCEDLKPCVVEQLCDLDDFRFVLAVDGDQDCSFERQLCLGGFLCLVERLAVVGRQIGRAHV